MEHNTNAEFKEAVRHTFDGIGAAQSFGSALCDAHKDDSAGYVRCDDCQTAQESYFSWMSCDSCGSHLGGDREDVTVYSQRDRDIYELSICIDCVLYLANGDLPFDD